VAPVASAQMDPHAGMGEAKPPEPPRDPVPTRLELQLIDRTGMIEASPRHGEGMEARANDHMLASADVELRSFTPDAVEEITRGRTDAAGNIVLDLGMRVPGSPFRLRATRADGRVFLAKQSELISGGGPMHLYRVTNDHSAVEQAVMRIATIAPGQSPSAERTRVQVRQIIQYGNGGFEAYDGPPGAEGIGFIFPVPKGAQVTDVKLGADALLDTEPRAIEHWGYGVPVPQPIFPLESALLMGVYELEVAPDELFDLGLEAAVHTRGMQLSLEANQISYDPAAVVDAGETPLASQGTQEMRDVGRNMTMYTTGAIEAHGRISVPARLGPPPPPPREKISTGAILMALLIAACFAVPIVAGIAIAKRRGAGRSAQARADEMRALHAAGELSDADLERELARIGAADPAVLARLDEISTRAASSPDSVSADLRDLARIVRDHLRERAR